MLSGMEITAYVIEEGRLAPLHVSAPSEIPARAIWVDVIEPTREEVFGIAE